jgi:hypothetical protein
MPELPVGSWGTLTLRLLQSTQVLEQGGGGFGGAIFNAMDLRIKSVIVGVVGGETRVDIV